MNTKNFTGNLPKLSAMLFVITFVLTLSFPSFVSGQKKQINDLQISKTYLFKLKDGSEFLGSLTSQDSTSIIISTKSVPTILIPKDKIKSIDYIDSSRIKKGKYWFPNPNSTRYVFAPSAYTLKKGEGYYQNTLLFLNSFDLGITNNVSVGGGIEFLSTFASISSGDFSPIFYLTSKAGFKITDKFNAAGGIMAVSIPSFGSENRHYAGLLYGAGTYGSPDHNITGSLSWGSIDGEFSATPVINLSAMTRISKRTALITENWLIPADGIQAIYSYGIRFFGEKIAVDLAFVNNKDIVKEIALGIPIVDFVVKF